VKPVDVVATAEDVIADIEARGHRADLGYAGVSTVFRSDEPGTAEWLESFFEGYVEPSPTKDGRVTVYSTGHPALLDSLRSLVPSPAPGAGADRVRIPLTDSALLVRPAAKAPAREDVFHLLFPEDRRIVSVTSGGPEVRREQGRRTVRAANKWLLLEQGWIPMHSACAAKDGRAICVVGQKGSGKTSTLLNLLARNACDLVAIDKFLVRDGGEGVEVCGIPGRVGIRVGSAIAQPRVLAWLDSPSFFPHISREEARHIAETSTVEELRRHKEKIHLLPAELTAMFGRTITRTAPLELLLFPVFDPDIETARLVPTGTERSARMLTDCYVSLSSKGEDFLLDFFDLSDTTIRDRLAALVARHLPGIPAYELRQSHRTNEQAARLIGDLLVRDAQEVPR
jgi:hypothetical protein